MIYIPSDLEQLIALSQQVGVEKFSIQGGGGNTSVKLSPDVMAIKASGYRLQDLNLTNGISFVALPQIQKIIADCTEMNVHDLDSSIQKQMIQFQNLPTLRPSIETGFHTLFDKFVVHTHSVYANVLNCCEEGRQLVQKIFPEAVWLDYFTPGAPLTLALRDQHQRNPSQIYFLANHGVILTHPTSAGVMALHHLISSRIQKFLEFDVYPQGDDGELDLSFIRQHVLFPDQIVYALTDETLSSAAAQETLLAYKFIQQSILKNKLSPRYLALQEVQRIHEMESEKYRKKMVQ